MKPGYVLAALGGLAVGAWGCVTAPTTTVAPRDATVVNASFDSTWNGAIDIFATRNIPIRTMEKASGFIATENLVVNDARDLTLTWADCGADTGTKVAPARATYNVLVRGDSVRSTVRVTVDWTGFVVPFGARVPVQQRCVTSGVWERGVESAIKAGAERSSGSGNPR